MKQGKVTIKKDAVDIQSLSIKSEELAKYLIKPVVYFPRACTESSFIQSGVL